MKLDIIFEETEQARSAWNRLFDRFLDGSYDVDGDRPGIGDQSLRLLHRRLLLVIEVLLGIRPKDQESSDWIAFIGVIPQIQADIQVIGTGATSLLATFEQSWREGTSIRDASGNFSLELVVGDEVTATVDGLPAMRQIHKHLDRLQARIGQVLPFVRADGVTDLGARAVALSDSVREVSAQRSRAAKSAEAAQTCAAAAEDAVKAVRVALADSQTALEKIQALEKQATTDLSNVTALVEKVKTVGADAGSLEQQVADYQAKFDAFQKQLDERMAFFAKFEADTAKAAKDSSAREAEIDRLTKQADFMISGATTAGLAKSMEDARVRYQSRMRWARSGFILSIFILGASAVPLAAHLLPKLFESWVGPSPNGNERDPYVLLGKIFLLLPASWLTAFFTKSYADFFHLEREYAHKAALAMSVDGFKRQAPNYEQEITAEVFSEIRNNPASKPGPEPATHPLYGLLGKAVDKVLPKKGGELP